MFVSSAGVGFGGKEVELGWLGWKKMATPCCNFGSKNFETGPSGFVSSYLLSPLSSFPLQPFNSLLLGGGLGFVLDFSCFLFKHFLIVEVS